MCVASFYLFNPLSVALTAFAGQVTIVVVDRCRRAIVVTIITIVALTTVGGPPSLVRWHRRHRYVGM